MLTEGIWPWIWFNLFIIALLAIDLGIFNRKAHTVSLKEALTWSGVWIALSLMFNAGIYFLRGPDPAIQFFTGYLIEKSLSVDNIFVFVLVFTYFKVPTIYQHRVLFWGVLGALVLRGAMIAIGATLIEDFHWIIYIFGAFLVFTGIRMAFQKNDGVNPEKNPLLKFVRRVLPVTEDYEQNHFVVRRAAQIMATPLLLVLIVIETTDLVFAVDSIPAIFAVTTDPFIVYTSNVLAILGLRSLYFVFANVIHKFYYLKPALAVILTYVGVKMLLADIFKIPTAVSLLIIVLVLAIAIVASLMRDRHQGADGARLAEDTAQDKASETIHK